MRSFRTLLAAWWVALTLVTNAFAQTPLAAPPPVAPMSPSPSGPQPAQSTPGPPLPTSPLPSFKEQLLDREVEFLKDKVRAVDDRLTVYLILVTAFFAFFGAIPGIHSILTGRSAERRIDQAHTLMIEGETPLKRELHRFMRHFSTNLKTP